MSEVISSAGVSGAMPCRALIRSYRSSISFTSTGSSSAACSGSVASAERRDANGASSTPRDRLRGESGDQVPQIHGLSRQCGAEGELVGHSPVVAYERHGVLPQGHRNLKGLGVHPARHPHSPQHIETDQPQLNHTGLDRGHVHGVNAPGMPQPFRRGGDVGWFLPRSEPQTEPQPG